MDNTKRRLLWHGIFLFLLGLITGLLPHYFNNPRMGLSAHLEGLMNGIFLLAIGSIWMEVMLSTRLKAVAFWCAIYGTYINWATTFMAAVFGTGTLTPIASGGRSAIAWQETLVTIGFTSVALAIICACMLILWGLRRDRSE